MTTTPPPRCPYCNAQGINSLEAKTAGFFAVIYCRKCGAIHGVVPAPQPPAVKPAQETPKPEPVAPIPPPEPFDLRKIDIEMTDIEKPKAEQKLTPARAQAMMEYYIQPGSTMYRVIRKDDEES